MQSLGTTRAIRAQALVPKLRFVGNRSLPAEVESVLRHEATISFRLLSTLIDLAEALLITGKARQFKSEGSRQFYVGRVQKQVTAGRKELRSLHGDGDAVVVWARTGLRFKSLAGAIFKYLGRPSNWQWYPNGIISFLECLE